MMGQIYTKANACLIWLSDGGTLAIEVIQRLQKGWFSIPDGEPIYQIDVIQTNIRPAITNLHPEQSLAVFDFLSLSWFSRIWVLQEVILAKKVVAMCGSKIIRFQPIIHFGHVLMTCDAFADIGVCARKCRDIGYSGFLQIQKACSALRLMFVSNSQLNKEGTSLDITFTYAMELYATDDKDKIYGILGLARSSANFASRITVDYTLTADRVYPSATVAIAKSDETLNILTRVCDPRRRKYRGLPSWCPDYTVSSTLSQSGMTVPVIWGNTLRPVIESSSDSLTLTVEGIRFDAIYNMTDRPEPWQNVPDVPDAYTLLVEIVALTTTLDFKTPSRVTSLWGLLMGPFLHKAAKYPPNVEYLVFPTVLIGLFLVAVQESWSRGVGSDPHAEIFTLMDSLASLQRSVHTLSQLEPENILFLPDTRILAEARKVVLEKNEGALEAFLYSLMEVDLLLRAKKAGLEKDLLALVGIQSSVVSKQTLWELLQSYIAKTTAQVGVKLAREVRYFTSSNLQLIGFGDGRIDERCEIWILHGCQLPVLLRRKGESHYEFCGTANVCGSLQTDGTITRINLV